MHERIDTVIHDQQTERDRPKRWSLSCAATVGFGELALVVVASELVGEIATLILQVGDAILHVALQLIKLAFGFLLLIVCELSVLLLGLTREFIFFCIKSVSHAVFSMNAVRNPILIEPGALPATNTTHNACQP